ncbi:HEPN domain-containing protein [Actinocatenispora thailandica]|uniref:HEPN domain-containing protein n=1 Tax=Actinocatenispora thailandica TaxID=227318 RepID=UPI00194EC820
MSEVQSKFAGGLSEAAIRISQAPAPERPFIVQRFIGEAIDGRDETFLTYVRSACGVEIPQYAASDDFERVLLQVGFDIFPALLLELEAGDNTSPYQASLVLNSISIPMHERMVQAAIEVDEFRRLFPDYQPESIVKLEPLWRVSAFVQWLRGDGGSVTLGMLPASVVAHAVTMTGILNEITIEECFLNIRKAIKLAKGLASGASCKIPQVVGLSGVRLEDDVPKIELSGATLTNANSFSAGYLRGWGSARDPAAVLVVDVDEEIIKLSKDVESAINNSPISMLPGSASRRARDDVIEQDRKEVDLARYALLLASPFGEIYASQVEVATVLNPVRASGSAQVPVGIRHGGSSVEIGAAWVSDIQMLSSRIRESHPSSLNIGIKRLLSAAADRIDPMDSFIDAVMCWENLFGGAQETTFKVCASLAMMLEPDDVERRRALFKKAQDLYNARSKLVHGVSEPSFETAQEYRRDALLIAMRALRQAYSLPRFLALKGSVERHKYFLLNFGSNGEPMDGIAPS